MKSKKSGKVRREKSEKQAVVWAALSLTGQIIGHIKNVQKGYLRVGQCLAKVRDEKLFELLGHPDLADYAFKRLDLSKTSLYRYLQIFDWVSRNKPEFLDKGYKGRIPELADMSVALQADEQLVRSPRMREMKRKGLEAIKQQALAGNLDGTVAAKSLKKNNKISDPLAAFALKIQKLRRSGAGIAGMPPEALAHLDSAVAILTTEQKVALAGLHIVPIDMAALA